MIKVDKDHVSMLMLSEVYSEKNKAEEKIRLSKHRYQTDLLDFEKQLFINDEDFNKYDDYMEWKAYENYLKDIDEKIAEIKSGNIQVAWFFFNCFLLQDTGF